MRYDLDILIIQVPHHDHILPLLTLPSLWRQLPIHFFMVTVIVVLFVDGVRVLENVRVAPAPPVVDDLFVLVVLAQVDEADCWLPAVREVDALLQVVEEGALAAEELVVLDQLHR